MAEWRDSEYAEELDQKTEETQEYGNPEDIREEAAAEPAQEAQDDIPEKYRGKSFEDVVRMHSEAEKLIGKHSQEVGELRHAVDAIIQQNMTKAPETEEEVDFFEDPEKAVMAAVSKHPDVLAARQQAQALRQSQTLSQLQTKHPDMKEVISDPAFREWVWQSKARQRMYREADQQYDYDAADELLSTYKQIKGMANDVKKNEDVSRRNAVRSAGTGRSSGGAAAPVRKTYRRADIIKLMKTDPRRYEMLADEIQQAYAEGRVR